MALRTNIDGGVVGTAAKPGGGGPMVANGIRAFKTLGAQGAWINGRWHSNGAAAAMTGETPPLEKVTPAYPGMLELLTTKVDKDGKPTVEAETAKASLVSAQVAAIKADDHAEKIGKIKDDVLKDAKSKATEKATEDRSAAGTVTKVPGTSLPTQTNTDGSKLPPITGTMKAVEKPDIAVKPPVSTGK